MRLLVSRYGHPGKMMGNKSSLVTNWKISMKWSLQLTYKNFLDVQNGFFVLFSLNKSMRSNHPFIHSHLSTSPQSSPAGFVWNLRKALYPEVSHRQVRLLTAAHFFTIVPLHEVRGRMARYLRAAHSMLHVEGLLWRWLWKRMKRLQSRLPNDGDVGNVIGRSQSGRQSFRKQ